MALSTSPCHKKLPQHLTCAVSHPPCPNFQPSGISPKSHVFEIRCQFLGRYSRCHHDHHPDRLRAETGVGHSPTSSGSDYLGKTHRHSIDADLPLCNLAIQPVALSVSVTELYHHLHSSPQPLAPLGVGQRFDDEPIVVGYYAKPSPRSIPEYLQPFAHKTHSHSTTNNISPNVGFLSNLRGCKLLF